MDAELLTIALMDLALRRRAASLILVFAAVITLSGCFHHSPVTPDPVGISAETIFWQAYTDPQSFDQWLTTQTVDRNSAACLRSRSQTLSAQSQSRLRECRQLTSYTTEWNRCHEESEQMESASVVANDIANAIDRTRRFDASSGGQMLIQTRFVVGVANWNETITLLRQVMPRFSC